MFPRTDTVVSVFASAGTTSQVRFIPTATAVNNETSIEARTPGVVTGAWMRSFLSTRGFRFREYCYVDPVASAAANGGTTTDASTTGLGQKPHSYLLNVRGTQTTANLVISVGGLVRGNGRFRVDVDIDADNSIEYSYTANNSYGVRVIPMFRGGMPRPIRVTVDAAVGPGRPGSSYDLTTLIRLENPLSGRCHFSRLGPLCDPIVLDGIDQGTVGNHSLLFNVSNGPANASGALLFGANSGPIPLPGIPCPVYTIPVAVSPIALNAAGDAQLTVPAMIRLNGTILQQAAVVNAGVVVLSNPLRIDCLDG